MTLDEKDHMKLFSFSLDNKNIKNPACDPNVQRSARVQTCKLTKEGNNFTAIKTSQHHTKCAGAPEV
jgi:hypothetical protein